MKVKLDENLGSLGADCLRARGFDVLTAAGGIVAVRPPGRLRLAVLERALDLVVEASKVSDVRGRLGIAEADRLREHLGQSE